MSGKKIRIVDGEMTITAKGNYSMYATESNIDMLAGKRVVAKGSGKGVVYGKYKDPPLMKGTSESMVLFRPHSAYDGEFGFDWIRMGDTGVKGDTWYRNIVGRYFTGTTNTQEEIYTGGVFRSVAAEYDKLLRTFENFIVPWKKYKNGKPFLYTIPVLSLLPTKSAKLSIKIEIKELPDKLIVRQRKSTGKEKDFFTFSKKNLPIKKGVQKLNDFLEITCKEEFSKDQVIEIIGVKNGIEHVAGAIKVLKNSAANQRKTKVVFVRVKTTNGLGSVANEKERLEKYLNQAYVNVELKIITIDLTTDTVLRTKLNSNSGIHAHLETKLRAGKFPDGTLVGNKYDSFYRVYFLSEVIALSSGGYLLGQAQGIPSKAVFVLNLQGTATQAGVSFESVKTTATHELLHGIGLNHTFGNTSLFTFEKFRTDNIMDYYTTSTDIKAKQMYKWQWKIVQGAIT
jgi:hypothetical protein